VLPVKVNDKVPFAPAVLAPIWVAALTMSVNVEPVTDAVIDALPPGSMRMALLAVPLMVAG